MFANIQNAINQISDGGIIEIASGTYQPPSQGYTILQLNKDLYDKSRCRSYSYY